MRQFNALGTGYYGARDTIQRRRQVTTAKDESPEPACLLYSTTSFSFLNDGDKGVSADGIKRDVEYDSMATVTTDEWSLLCDTKPSESELYNLKSDPKQEKNVISQHPDKARELHQLFVKHMRDANVPKRFLELCLELLL